MPPVLGYYRRHHFYVMKGANNEDVVGRRMEMGGKSWGFGVGARRGEPEGGGAPGGGLV